MIEIDYQRILDAATPGLLSADDPALVYFTRRDLLEEEMEGIVLKGVGQDFDWSFMERYLQEGEPLIFSDSLISLIILLYSCFISSWSRLLNLLRSTQNMLKALMPRSLTWQ